MHRLVVDRVEGELAAVEVDGGAVLDLPRWLLPPGAREGDVVQVEVHADGRARSLRLQVDAGATAAAREDAEALLKRLRDRDPGGDVQL